MTNKYIVVKLYGGLGNQLFQIAYACSLCKKYNRQILVDKSEFKKYKIRKYALDNIIISSDFSDINDINIPSFIHNYYTLTSKTYHVFQKIIEITNSRYLYKPLFSFLTKFGLFYSFDDSIVSSKYYGNRNIFIYGYFQSEKYFKEINNEIKSNFKIKTIPSIKEKEIINKMASSNSVAISLRLDDDYKNHKEFNVCTKEYFYKAIEYICKRIDNPKFYIFSDRIDRAKILFKFNIPVEYIEGFKDYESLRLMYSCKHFILSNSSFSWWGAYLSDNPNKIIIVPNKWTNNGRLSEIYTTNMIKIGL